MTKLEFKKNGKSYDILAEGALVGTMYKDEDRNYMFAVVAKLNFEIEGKRNDFKGKTYKDVKVGIQKLYNTLQQYI